MVEAGCAAQYRAYLTHNAGPEGNNRKYSSMEKPYSKGFG